MYKVGGILFVLIQLAILYEFLCASAPSRRVTTVSPLHTQRPARHSVNYGEPRVSYIETLNFVCAFCMAIATVFAYFFEKYNSAEEKEGCCGGGESPLCLVARLLSLPPEQTV